MLNDLIFVCGKLGMVLIEYGVLLFEVVLCVLCEVDFIVMLYGDFDLLFVWCMFCVVVFDYLNDFFMLMLIECFCDVVLYVYLEIDLLNFVFDYVGVFELGVFDFVIGNWLKFDL